MASIADLSMSDDEKIRLSSMGARLKELHSSIDDKRMREALNHLVDVEIISSDSHFDSFSFRIDLVRLWLKEAHSLGKSIEEYIRDTQSEKLFIK